MRNRKSSDQPNFADQLDLVNLGNACFAIPISNLEKRIISVIQKITEDWVSIETIIGKIPQSSSDEIEKALGEMIECGILQSLTTNIGKKHYAFHAKGRRVRMLYRYGNPLKDPAMEA